MELFRGYPPLSEAESLRKFEGSEEYIVLKKKSGTLSFLGLIAGAALMAAAANAGPILTYTLDQDGCSGGCGTTPFATVKLTQSGNSVIVLETLVNATGFVLTGAGEALEFNITGDPAINITGITSGFSIGPAPASASTFGSFDYSVHCSGCGSGGSSPLSGPLTFTVSLTGGGTLSTTDFIANGVGGYFFASDVMGSNGKTGDVADNATGVATVPEPLSLGLTGTGLALLGLGGARLRRKQL